MPIPMRIMAKYFRIHFSKNSKAEKISVPFSFTPETMKDLFPLIRADKDVLVP